MAQSVQLKGMSRRHDAIAEWLIANPEKSMAECASTFGVTRPWLSSVVHSDIFQTYYRKLRDGYVDDRIMPMRDKLQGLAVAAIERISDKLEEINDTRLLKDIADMSLKNLGFGAPKVGAAVQINNNTFASSLTPSELDAAREAYRARQRDLTSIEDGQVVNG